MRISDARTLLAYNQWANQQLLAAARSLPVAQFAQDLRASFGSIKGTLAHILDGEWHWLQFWQGKPRTKRAAPDDFPDAAALARAFSQLEQEQRAFVDGLSDDLLQVRWTIRDQEYGLGQLLQHVVNHSTYHRGQVATLLRQAGHTPPATDFRVYLDHVHSQAQAARLPNLRMRLAPGPRDGP